MYDRDEKILLSWKIQKINDLEDDEIVYPPSNNEEVLQFDREED